MRAKIKKYIPKEILYVLKQLRYIWLSFLFYGFRILPINNKLVVLCNVWGVGDNAKYVMQELLRQKREKALDIRIVFITNNPNRYRDIEGVNVKKTNSVSAVYSLVTAKVWLDNNRKENFTRKRKGQFYIQTWHGGIALKKIEADYEQSLSKAYIRNAKKDSAMTDLYISNSNFCSRMYVESFWYHGPILECGSPRNDILLEDGSQINEKVRDSLGIKDDNGIVIYAPTYRDGDDMSPYELDYNRLVQSIEERFGQKFTLVVRLHPLVVEKSSNLTYSHNVINGSKYPDMYELMVAGDVLITDYSNTMFEFSYSRKPVFLYAKDKVEYEKERGFYFTYDSLPYPISVTEEELVNNIINYNESKEKEKVDEFFQKIQLYEEGHASEVVSNEIIRRLG